MSDTVTSLYVEEESTNELIRGLQSLKISDAHSSVCSNILSNCDNEDKAVNINSNNELLCTNVNNLKILQHIYTDSEDDSDSEGDDEEIFCDNPAEMVKPISGSEEHHSNDLDQHSNTIQKSLVISNCVLTKGVKYLTRTVLIQELEANNLSTDGIVAELKERLISAINASYPQWYELPNTPNSSTKIINHESEKFDSSVQSNKTAILNMENEIQKLKLQIDSTNINFMSLKNANQLCNPAPAKITTTCGPLCENLAARVEYLEDSSQKSKEDFELIEKAFIDLSDEAGKCITEVEKVEAFSNQLNDLQQRFEGSENLISEAYQEVEQKIAQLSAAQQNNTPRNNAFTAAADVPTGHVTPPRARARNRVDNRSYSHVSNNSGHPIHPTRRERTPQHSRHSRSKKIIILRDSLLRDFDGTAFSAAFQNPSVFNVGSLKELMSNENLFRRIYSEPNVDGYIIALGINDLKNDSPDTVFKRIRVIYTKLLETTNAKITVSLVLPVSGNANLNNKVLQFNKLLTASCGRYRTWNINMSNFRLYTVPNANFLKPDIARLDHCFSDGLHLSNIGLRMFCANLKLSQYKAFGMTLNRYGPGSSETRRNNNYE